MNRIKLFTKFGHDIFSWHLREKNIVIKKLKWIDQYGNRAFWFCWRCKKYQFEKRNQARYISLKNLLIKSINTSIYYYACSLMDWRNYEIITANYCCVRHKNRRKHNLHFKQLFFRAYLYFGKSNLLCTYRKTSLVVTINIDCNKSSCYNQ